MDTRQPTFNHPSENHNSEGEIPHDNSSTFFRASKCKKSNFYMEFDLLKARYLNNELSILQLVQALNLIDPPAHIQHPFAFDNMPILLDQVQNTHNAVINVDFNALSLALNQDNTPGLSLAVCGCAIDAFRSKWHLEEYKPSSKTAFGLK